MKVDVSRLGRFYNILGWTLSFVRFHPKTLGRRGRRNHVSPSARLLKLLRLRISLRARFCDFCSKSPAVSSDVLQNDHLTVGALQEEVQLAMLVWVTERD